MKTLTPAAVAVLFGIALTCFAVAAEQETAAKKQLDVGAKFYPSGWMGDGTGSEARKYIQFDKACRDNPHSKPVCIKVRYTPGPEGWAGIYWQNKPNNWGGSKGDNLVGYNQLTFWAKGLNGDETVEFKAGDIRKGPKNPNAKYEDSFEVSLGDVMLTKEWKQYTIDLKGKDLSSVIGGFCWVATRDGNPQGLTFFLDDICYSVKEESQKKP